MPQFIVEIARLPGDLIRRFAGLSAATVYEAGAKQGAMDHTIRPIQRGMALCGSALTVHCHPADNLTLHAAIALAQPGDVIVADVGDYPNAGYWGEITTTTAQARGIAGLVINGGVRDVGPIGRRGFPVFSRSVCMRATVKETPGLINHPIVCGGVLVRPGDLVVGDDDGVVVVRREQAETILSAAIARDEREADVMRRLVAGELTLDVLGFRRALERRGLTV